MLITTMSATAVLVKVVSALTVLVVLRMGLSATRVVSKFLPKQWLQAKNAVLAPTVSALIVLVMRRMNLNAIQLIQKPFQLQSVAQQNNY